MQVVAVDGFRPPPGLHPLRPVAGGHLPGRPIDRDPAGAVDLADADRTGRCEEPRQAACARQAGQPRRGERGGIALGRQSQRRRQSVGRPSRASRPRGKAPCGTPRRHPTAPAGGSSRGWRAPRAPTGCQAGTVACRPPGPGAARPGQCARPRVGGVESPARRRRPGWRRPTPPGATGPRPARWRPLRTARAKPARTVGLCRRNVRSGCQPAEPSAPGWPAAWPGAAPGPAARTSGGRRCALPTRSRSLRAERSVASDPSGVADPRRAPAATPAPPRSRNASVPRWPADRRTRRSWRCRACAGEQSSAPAAEAGRPVVRPDRPGRCWKRRPRPHPPPYGPQPPPPGVPSPARHGPPALSQLRRRGAPARPATRRRRTAAPGRPRRQTPALPRRLPPVGRSDPARPGPPRTLGHSAADRRGRRRPAGSAAPLP